MVAERGVMDMREIAGYVYEGIPYLPEKIIPVLLDNYEASPAALDMPVEEALDQIAAANGIDRDDENSFSDKDFPKRIYWDDVDRAEDWWWLEIDPPWDYVPDYLEEEY